MTAAGFLIPAVLTAVIETVFFWVKGRRDRDFLSRGLDRILNFVLIYVRKK